MGDRELGVGSIESALAQPYGQEYHSVNHARHLMDARFYSFLSYIAEQKYWRYLRGCSAVLEVGCGTGQNICGHPEATGIDISGFAVSACKERGINAAVLAVEALPSLGKTYDGVICAHVLEHLERPYDILQMFRQLLSPQGKLVLSLPVTAARSRKRDQHLYCWNEMEITNLLERTGFKVLRCETWALWLKILACRLPFQAGYTISKWVGYIVRALRWRPAVNDLTIYAVRQD
jgi:SAM-dependent methyltransferase